MVRTGIVAVGRLGRVIVFQKIGTFMERRRVLERITIWSGHSCFGVRHEEYSFVAAELPKFPNNSPEQKRIRSKNARL